jgi:hypothetical protein
LRECRLFAALMPVARCVAPACPVSAMLSTVVSLCCQRMGVTHSVCASGDVTPRSRWAPCRVAASWCLSSGMLRRCREGGDGLSRNGSTLQCKPTRSWRTLARGGECSACSAGRWSRDEVVVVVVVLWWSSRRVLGDRRPCCIRILKDAGRETAVANTKLDVGGGATVRLCDGVISWREVVKVQGRGKSARGEGSGAASTAQTLMND